LDQEKDADDRDVLLLLSYSSRSAITLRHAAFNAGTRMPASFP
jgi:hypothetical protein